MENFAIKKNPICKELYKASAHLLPNATEQEKNGIKGQWTLLQIVKPPLLSLPQSYIRMDKAFLLLSQQNKEREK